MGYVMTDKENRTKKIHYRYASFFKKSALTLQEMLVKALKVKSTVSSRYQVLGISGAEEAPAVALEREFINTNISRYGMFFGSLVRYEAGSNKHIVTLDDNATTLSLAQIAPPASKDGKRSEFLDSILYFGVFGNHVVILQSASLRTRELEKHLNWFFRQCNLFNSEQAVSLDQQLTDEAKDRILNAPTKRLKVGAPFDPAAEEVNSEDVQSQNAPSAPETKRISFHRTGPGWNVLKALGFTEGSIGEQLEQDLNDSSNLEIKVEISYKHSPKGETQRLMNGLTKALRHTELEDYEVDFKGAGTLKGDKLILSADVSFSYYKGLVDEEDFYTKIHSWITERIKEKVLKV